MCNDSCRRTPVNAKIYVDFLKYTMHLYCMHNLHFFETSKMHRFKRRNRRVHRL
jgi:hypothetical protein